VNPLYLLRALYADFQTRGGQVMNGNSVESISRVTNGFSVQGAKAAYAEKVVLAAGLGNRKLGKQLDLHLPVKPDRGQLLICERTQPFMKYPSVQIRQVGEGPIQIGDSSEDVGFDDNTSAHVIARIASRAAKIYPLLRHLQVVRSWAALRVMTPDGFPIYQQSNSYSGAYAATCHSGVTLAAAHALLLPQWIANNVNPEQLESFSGDRFQI